MAPKDTPKPGPPEQVGRYRVLERIGRGAMGVVYRARDEAMGRDVAVKVLVADLEEEPEIRTRFLREAESAARLSHPNVIKIFDVGEDHERFYIVMELLRGATLKDYLGQSDAAPLGRKLDLMIQLCAGLGAAHNASIYHRDIKPGNIFVRTDGNLKILDFGVARVASSNMTAAGFVIGTPDYMSPEQARGNAIDARSDIFSAGGVFYFMVTGRKPFAAKDLPTIFRQVQFEDPVALEPAEAPPALARVIMKALAKDRALRHQSCAELMAELVEVRNQHAAEAHRIAAARRNAEVVAQSAASTPGARDDDDEITTFAAQPRTDETIDYGPASPGPTVVARTVPAPVTDSAKRSPESAAPSSRAGDLTGPRLVVFRGDAVVREIPLVGNALRIGRDPGNDLVLEDSSDSVAPFHAEVRPNGAAYTVVDLDSRTGLWVGGRRVPNAVLGLGAPITVGPYELLLEDDNASQDFDAPTLVNARIPKSVAPALPTPAPAVAGRPAPRAPVPLRAAAVKSRTPLWLGVAAAAVAVVAVSFGILQYSRRTPDVAPSPSPGVPAAPSAPSAAAQAPASPATEEIAQHLAAARTLIASGDLRGAIDNHLQPVLTLDPQNSDAAAMKAQAEELIAKANAASAKAARPKAPVPDVVLAVGIPRLPNESARDYSERSRRIQTRYAQGKTELGQKQFAAAVSSFQAVDRDQPEYLDVRSLLADATAQRSAALREAMDSGARNEAAGQLRNAWEWYVRAEQYDTSSAAAEKSKAIRERMGRDAAAILERARVFEVMRRPGDATRLYEQVVSLLPEGDETRIKAEQQLKVLKQ